ncbi:MAG: 6-carboxytetrahydropterin synthase QueD [Alphaproteobacteria bacterium]|nr:6-carboxytetrahydropterin synthase QueD [Alphaproteobacteria bacterium]
MFTICKEYHFSASHQLFGLADDHPCARLHGHNYVIEIELQSEKLNEVGFIRDYRDLDALKKYIDDKFDHYHLNDVLGDENVTAERIAKHFYDWCHDKWPEVSAVRVKETPKTCAEYRSSKLRIRKNE